VVCVLVHCRLDRRIDEAQVKFFIVGLLLGIVMEVVLRNQR
jgi:hypothetical protein